MARPKSIWTCSECGAQAPRWLGRCSECGSFGTLVEEVLETGKSTQKPHHTSSAKTVLLSNASLEQRNRISTHIEEFDRVLGGGLVVGSLTLLSGEPGIGKSTLLLQTAGSLAQKGKNVLYACGEESVEQVALRAQRLGLRDEPIAFLPEVNIDTIIETALREKPDVLIVDSIQTAFSEELTGAPGSVGQVRACALALMRLAKEHGITTIVVGHVTKDGGIAGPRVLEHMVDTVLQFEGDKENLYRLVRAIKNRFGSTSEIGIFEMMGDGLREVSSPSDVFIEHYDEPISGSVYFASCEGTRPLLVEVQALVTPSYLPSPRRLANGIDKNRLLQVIAVLERRAHISFANLDVIVSIAGGARIAEPALDLPLALSLISAHKDSPLKEQTVAFGEIALTGKVRQTPRSKERAKEAQNLGLTHVLSSQQISSIAECMRYFPKD